MASDNPEYQEIPPLRNFMNSVKGEQIHADTFLKENFSRLTDWAVGDIKKSSNNTAYIGASILWICAIEFFGGLLTGCFDRKETKRRIYTFVNNYLKKYGNYDPVKLYDLRWSLVHFYSVRHYTLDHSEKTRKHHLKKIKNRDHLLHIGQMIDDLEKAVEDFTKDLWNKPELRIRAYRYFRKIGPLMVIDDSKIEF